MSNVVVHKNNGDKPAISSPQSEPLRDAIRVMRALLSWDPFHEMVPLQMVEEREPTFAPAFDIKETNDAYVFRADVPGVKESDIEVTLTGNRLTIGGKRESEKEDRADRYYTYERAYGSFSRSFTLPEGVDADRLQASLEGGVVEVKVPKKPEVQPKKIDVKSGAGSKQTGQAASKESGPATPKAS